MTPVLAIFVCGWILGFLFPWRWPAPGLRALLERARFDLERGWNAAAVVDYVRAQLATGAGVRLTASELANEGGPIVDGKPLKRDTIRRAVRHAVAQGLLTQLGLPKAERQGSRQTYLAPADYRPTDSVDGAP